MRNNGKILLHQTSGKSSNREMGSTLTSFLQNKNNCKISYAKRSKMRPRSHVKTIGSFLSKRRSCEFSSNEGKNKSMNGKWVQPLQNGSEVNSSTKRSSFVLLGGKPPQVSCKINRKNTDGDDRNQVLKRRKSKKKKEVVQQDEASRLKRRTRYLIIKMKLEQNLIDAYSGEGWKGQSREKIKPEKELKRAEEQILKCKLGIRDAIQQLDLLSSEGRIEDSVIDADGSVFHEHIFCAKCKLRDAFPDNDIILCDGTCNCAFHQKCLEPPLATENIPPDDQGWFCKFCECKMEILEAVNAHIGTRFSVNNKWQDIFEESATAPDGEITSLDPKEEWPSEDSEDEDYNPEGNEERSSMADVEEYMSDDLVCSSGLLWSSDEASSQSGRSLNTNMNKASSRVHKGNRKTEQIDFVKPINLDSDDTIDREITSRRQRKDVDYKKLHDEMFGKGLSENEQLSEDEDWGPGRRKCRLKESDDGPSVSNNYEGVEVKKNLPSASQDKKPLFRIPANAVEKLRQVFAENELPSRAVKETLSKQLGIATDKVSKWFKNARYTALKVRKAGSCCNSIPERSHKETGKKRSTDRAASKANSHLVPLQVGIHTPNNLRRICRRKTPKSITMPLRKQLKRPAGTLPTNTIEILRSAFTENQSPSISTKRRLSKQLGLPYHQVSIWFSNTVCFRKQMGSSTKNRTSQKKANTKHGKDSSSGSKINDTKQLYLNEMERLFSIEDRIEKLKKVLRACRDENHVSDETSSSEQCVVYIPVAEVREKV